MDSLSGASSYLLCAHLLAAKDYVSNLGAVSLSEMCPKLVEVQKNNVYQSINCWRLGAWKERIICHGKATKPLNI